MSIRFERQPRHCEHINKDVTLLVEFITVDGLPDDADLAWTRGTEECLNRKNCGSSCPGEENALKQV